MSGLGSRLRITSKTFSHSTMWFLPGLGPLLPRPSCWKVPPLWGLHIVWDYLLPSLVGVISSGNIPPMLDQITKIPEISQEAASLPATFLNSSICSLNLHHLGLLFRRSHISALSHNWELFQQHFSSVCEGFYFCSVKSLQSPLSELWVWRGQSESFNGNCYVFSRRNYSQQSLGLARRRQPDISS